MANAKAKTAAEQSVEEVEAIDPTYEVREYTLGVGDDASTYTQKPLTFLRRMRFFALVGSTIRQATAVGGAGAVSDLLSGSSISERARQLGSSDMRDAESFINLAASLLVFVPDFLEDAYCELLSIPMDERPKAKHYMELSKEEGGLSDEDGMLIIQTFIDQNWEPIADFFGHEIPSLWKQIRSKTTEEPSDDE